MKSAIACFLGIFFTLVANAQKNNLSLADSLFRSGKQIEAQLIYEQFLEKTPSSVVPLPIYYKLAYIYEKQNDYTRTLYYLSMIYNQQPRQNILNKISEIAANHNLAGYEVDDFSFVFLFFKKYALYFTLFLLVVGMYAFGVLLHKSQNKENIRARHKWIVMAYLIALLLLLNLPDSYQIAIVHKSPAYLRDIPSSAAPAKWSIPKGNKVIVIGEEDQWLRIWWNQHPLYVRKIDVWAIL